MPNNEDISQFLTTRPNFENMLERDSQMDKTRFVSTAVQDLNARHNLLSITPNTNKDTIVHKNNFGDI
jgi:NifU-like protein involved in Fe-S cluster formation